MASRSLSSVVSNLVRAQMGASVPAAVPDDDLDHHVAQLILKEARQKEARYKGKDGIRAYLSSNDNAPKTNKRFLSTIIKNTDEHNKAILKAQADAVLEIKQQREHEEREERRRRAEEAKNARIESENHSSRWSRRSDKDDDRDWRVRREEERRKERPHRDEREHRSGYKRHREVYESDEDRNRERKRRRRHESEARERWDEHENEHDRDTEKQPDAEHRSSRRRRQHAERSRSRSSDDHEEREHRHRKSEHPSRHHRYSCRSSSRDGEEGESKRRREKRRKSEQSPSPVVRRKSSSNIGASKKEKDKIESATLQIEPTSESKRGACSHGSSEAEMKIGPTPPPQYSSKMDKYFAADYDPRLDFTPVLASDGFLPAGSFEGWDTMLQVIRLRREEKEEKKRLEKLGKAPGKSKDKGGAGDLDDIFSIEYTKRGATREWDEGKKVPT